MKKEIKQEKWLDHFSYYFNKYLTAAGIKVHKISFNKVPKTKLYRMKILADCGKMDYFEKHVLVQTILKDKFPYDEALKFCKVDFVETEI